MYGNVSLALGTLSCCTTKSVLDKRSRGGGVLKVGGWCWLGKVRGRDGQTRSSRALRPREKGVATFNVGRGGLQRFLASGVRKEDRF